MDEFYATVDADSIRPYMPSGVHFLLPASSWHRRGMKPPKLPRSMMTAADSGGFVAMRKWGGRYPYTREEYVGWLDSWNPDPPLWAAMRDWPCEPEISREGVRERQHRTTAEAYETWRNHRDVPWEWVPTIQGWTLEQYEDHVRDLSHLIGVMWEHYAVDSAGDYQFRIGIGTLCNRGDVGLIRGVVQAVNEILSLFGTPRIHLWGVKLATLQAGALPNVVSMDSAAWNGRFGRDIEQYRGSPLTQREYAYTVALPAYLAKVEAAVARGRERGVQEPLL